MASGASRESFWRRMAEVHLGLGARLALHPTEGQLRRGRQLPHEPPNAVVAAAKAVCNQILVNPLSRQALCKFAQDHLAVRLTLADVSGYAPEGRVSGWF